MTDPWLRQAALAREIQLWGGGSVLLGGLLGAIGAARRDARLQAFGLQNAGWGAIDYAIGVLAERGRGRKLARYPDPADPGTLARERRGLIRLLRIALVSDVGYVLSGWAWRRRGVRHGNRAAVGHGSAVLLQGAFLLIFDGMHAARLSGSLPSGADRRSDAPPQPGRSPR